MATFVEQTQASIAESVAAVVEYRSYAAAHPGEQFAEELLRCVAVIVTRLRARREVYVACGWQDVADMFTQGLEMCVASDGRYIVKCDECKKTIRRTDSLGESAAGGRCDTCKLAAMREP